MRASDVFTTPTGSVLMIMHKGGKYDIANDNIINGEVIARREIKNLIVNEASKFMAIRMAPGSAAGHLGTGDAYIAGVLSGEYESSGLKFLSVGVGQLKEGILSYSSESDIDTAVWPLQNPPAETILTTQLAGELYRKQFTDWKYLDETGNLAANPTNVLLLSTTFLETEAVGPLTEMGLFGGDNATSAANSGHMFNYKTFKVWNKPNDARLTIVWKLTF